MKYQDNKQFKEEVIYTIKLANYLKQNPNSMGNTPLMRDFIEKNIQLNKDLAKRIGDLK